MCDVGSGGVLNAHGGHEDVADQGDSPPENQIGEHEEVSAEIADAACSTCVYRRVFGPRFPKFTTGASTTYLRPIGHDHPWGKWERDDGDVERGRQRQR